MAQGNPQDPMDKFKAQETYYSFGDNGLTATVGANGFLLQMSRYFPDSEHKSGYCVDARDTPEPFLVDYRIQELYTRATNSSNNVSIQPSLDVTFKYDDCQCREWSQDRWPRFALTTEEGLTLRTQYLVSDNTLFQTWEFDYTSSDLPKTLPNITAVKGLLIRNLNYVDIWNPFNNDDEESNNDEGESNNDDQSKYKTEILSGGKSLMRSHIEEENAIALLLSVFHDKQYLNFTNFEDDFQLVWSQECLSALRKNKKFKITFAYRLEYVRKQDLCHILPPPPEKFVTQRTRLDKYGYSTEAFLDDTSLNFILGRNLEHILSVCSIPVTKEDSSGNQAIAFTCGDFDGHRVATAASFYCFQYLLQAFRHFQKRRSQACECGSLVESLGEAPDKSLDKPHQSSKMPTKELCYTCSMLSRIRKTCRGHLIWLFKRASSEDKQFGPNYWMNGKKIQDSFYLPEKCLVDTPFHIIKAGELYKALKEASEVEDSKDEAFSKHMGISLNDIQPVVDRWIEEIDERNKMGLYAFPSHKEGSYQTFYLTDHAFIWRAIRSAEDLGLHSRLCFPRTDNTQGDIKKAKSQKHEPASQQPKQRVYSSKTIQQNIQKRFTTENAVTKNRMIAVCRSPVENRFLFRNRDASLFHAMDAGLFDKSVVPDKNVHWRERVIDVWINTIDCQAQHEGRDDSGWNDPLRFALSFIVARWCGVSMNTRPLDKILDYAKSVLLQSAYCSGLFPGGLDGRLEPVIYDNERMRDTYWGVTFEIPYILWMYSAERSPSQNSDPPTHPENGREDSLTAVPNTCCHSCNDTKKKQLSGKGSLRPLVTLLKQSQPFNHVIYQENIVELSDEWLYNKPSFFHNASIDHLVSPSTGSSQGLQLLDGTNIALETHPNPPSSTHRGPGQGVVSESVCVVVDVPKRKTAKTMSKKSSSDYRFQTLVQSSEVSDIMREGRTPELAKKRFWYFLSPRPDREGMCRASFHKTSSSLPLSSSVADDPAEFFNRHLSYHKLFYEDIVPVQNTWTTECHLSCLALGKQISDYDNMSQSYRFPAYANGDIGKHLHMIMMSFRFDGDFFDRYWTCHFLEIDPLKDTNVSQIEDVVRGFLEHGPDTARQNERPKLSNADIDKKPWPQRKCLELLLFNRMMDQMNTQADEILEEAKRVIKYRGINDKSPSMEDDPNEMHYRDFRGANKRYQKVQEILQALEADLTDNLSEIDLWLDREKGRQIERPRWSFNDESRYGTLIAKLSSSNMHKIQQLRRIRNSISKYNEDIAKKLEVIRAGIDQRRAHDTQVFTSVTVIFLPLGFATGLFSMNEAPNNRTLYFMIITAVVAFVLTYLVLTLVNKEFYATGLKARIKSNLGPREQILLIRRKKAKVDEAV